MSEQCHDTGQGVSVSSPLLGDDTDTKAAVAAVNGRSRMIKIFQASGAREIAKLQDAINLWLADLAANGGSIHGQHATSCSVGDRDERCQGLTVAVCITAPSKRRVWPFRGAGAAAIAGAPSAWLACSAV